MRGDYTMIDRYTKIVLTVIALMLGALTVRPVVGPTPASGGAFNDPLPPPGPVEVPKSWGRVVGVVTHPTVGGYLFAYRSPRWDNPVPKNVRSVLDHSQVGGGGPVLLPQEN